MSLQGYFLITILKIAFADTNNTHVTLYYG